LRAQLVSEGFDPDDYFTLVDCKLSSVWRRSAFGRQRIERKISVFKARDANASLTA
jgi:hypothetical protein